MPPKAKFTKKQITDTALDLVRQNGIDALSARVLAKKLGTSVCPIFNVFKDMNELTNELKSTAKCIYKEYIKNGLSQDIAFKGVGTQYIIFAIREPKLFQFLFMTEQEQKPAIANVLPIIDESYNEILLSAQNGYNLTNEQAERLYRHLWIYTHGIAVLCATNMCVFTAEEISKMMTEAFKGILSEIKGVN